MSSQGPLATPSVNDDLLDQGENRPTDQYQQVQQSSGQAEGNVKQTPASGDSPSHAEDQAARLIQKHYRGYADRLQIKKMSLSVSSSLFASFWS